MPGIEIVLLEFCWSSVMMDGLDKFVIETDGFCIIISHNLSLNFI